MLETSKSEEFSPKIARSLAARETAFKIMVEAASDHVKRKIFIDRLPICSGYNFELCLRHIEGRSALQLEDLRDSISDMKALVGAFRQRWPRQDDPLGV